MGILKKILRGIGIKTRDRRTLRRATKLRRMTPAQLRAYTRRKRR